MLEGESRKAKAEKRKLESESWKADVDSQAYAVLRDHLSPEEEESPCRKGRSSILVSMALWPHPDPSRTRA